MTCNITEDPTQAWTAWPGSPNAPGLPLATNMVVTDFDEFAAAWRLTVCRSVLADHHYWGGLRDTQALAKMCQTFGLGVSMHSNSHLGISLMAMAHVAASVPNLEATPATPITRGESQMRR